MTTLLAREEEIAAQWSTVRAIAFRFMFLYLTLFLIPRPFTGDPLPRIPVLNAAIVQVWRWILRVVTSSVLGWPAADVRFNFGGGDAAVDYVRVACCAVIALGGTVLWSFAHRSKRGHDRLHEAFRTYLRLVLAIGMIGYAMPKLFGTQFTFSSMQLFRPVGQLEPMQLLWVFMGYSPGYVFFTGVVEFLGGVLLVFRRTTLLCALLVIAAMTNVVALNLSYDVGVKLFAIHLLLIAVVLVLPDAKRLVQVVLANSLGAGPGRVTGPSGATVTTVALVVVVAFAVVRFSVMFSEIRNQTHPSQPPPLHGMYEVTHFSMNDTPLAPLITDSRRWRRVVVDGTGSVAVQMMDDSVRRFTMRIDPGTNLVEIAAGNAGRLQFRYSELDAERISFRGGNGAERLDIVLRRIADQALPLRARAFRWVR